MKQLALVFLVAGILGSFWTGGIRAASEEDSASNLVPPGATIKLTTLALRVHRLEAMLAFYTEAFGAEFRPVETQGIESWFGEIGGVTFKFVPIRNSADFLDFPSHQPGFQVPSVEAVITSATAYGGHQEGVISRANGVVHGSVRDPDGNTLELYARDLMGLREGREKNRRP